MTTNEPSLCVLLLGTAGSPETAAAHARASSGCPYVAAYTASGCLTVGTYVLPESKRWWIAGIEDRPELLGLERIKLIYTEYADASSSWSRGEVRPVLETPPCGSHCDRCPMYQGQCSGCPASRYCKEG